MSQHDMNIADQAGASFLADLNAAFPAIASQNSGATDPPTMFAYQRIARTDLGVILRRNAANSGDLLDGTLAETFGVAKAATFTAGLADFKRLFVCSGTWSLFFAAAATLGDGWFCMVKNTGSGVITLDPNASETIDGATTLGLSAGESCLIYCNGTSLYTVGILSASGLNGLNPNLFAKTDPVSVAFVKTAAGTISVKAGTSAMVFGVKLAWAADTAITMPALVAGTDYAIYACTDGSIRADSNFSAPTGYTTANSRQIGGFHYGLVAAGTTVAGGAFATAGNGKIWVQADVDDIAGINKYSIWDLKFRPKCDPRGMVLVDGQTWVDIYLCSTGTATNGTSKYNTNIASGTVLPLVPASFGGNGVTTYPTLNWWVANELARANNKRLLSESEFVTAAYGVTENQSIDVTASTYPTTLRNAGYTSKYGIEQASGHQWVWGQDSNFYTEAASPAGSYKDVNGNNGAGTGRGQDYTFGAYGLARVILGGARAIGAYSGSRASNWGSYPWVSVWSIGLRAACDHMMSV